MLAARDLTKCLVEPSGDFLSFIYTHPFNHYRFISGSFPVHFRLTYQQSLISHQCKFSLFFISAMFLSLFAGDKDNIKNNNED